MSSEQDKRPSLVPLGVFGSSPSALPSPSASTTSHGTVTAPPVQPRAPASAPVPTASPAPSAASPEPGSQPPADRPSFPKTLVGVPALSPEAARASRGDFPAPPRWQGAAAYSAGAPPLRTSSGGPLPPGAQPPPAAASSALSAGAQPPSPFPLARDVPVLGRVNLRSTAVPVTTPAIELPATPRPAADDTEQELDLFDAIEEPVVPVAPPPVARVSARPLARPAQEARPQPASQRGEAAQAQPATRSSIPPVIVPDFARKDPSEVNIALPAPAAVPLIEAPAPAPRLAPVSAATPRARVDVDPGAPLLGVIFVAAMLVLGVGGWWLTRGGFVRPRHPEAVASAKPAEKKPTPPSSAPPAEAPPVQAPVVAPEAAPQVAPVAVEPPPAPAPAEPEPEPEPPSGAPVPRPRRAEPVRRQAAVSDRVPPPSPPARVDSAPLLTITPQSQTRAASESAPGAAMPDTPTRADVTRALDAVRAQVTACTGGKHGVAEVDLTVLSAGDVSHVVVTGDFAGSPEGSCIAREVRAARFSPFLKPRFRLIYPFQL